MCFFAGVVSEMSSPPGGVQLGGAAVFLWEVGHARLPNPQGESGRDQVPQQEEATPTSAMTTNQMPHNDNQSNDPCVGNQNVEYCSQLIS